MIHEKTFKERLSTLVGTTGNKAFERKTGVSAANIRKYLRGDGLPTLKVLQKIAKGNQVSICWLIGEDEHPFGKAAIPSYFKNKSMVEMAKWIGEQKDGIEYWEVAKARLARDFPDFKRWLRDRYKKS